MKLPHLPEMKLIPSQSCLTLELKMRKKNLSSIALSPAKATRLCISISEIEASLVLFG